MNAVGTTTQIHMLTAALKNIGLDARVWREQRIYINGLGRDISAYVTLDSPLEIEPGFLMEGCALNIFTSCEQPAAWRVNRCKQVKHGLMRAIHGAGLCGDLPAPCDRWEDVIL